MISGCFLAGQFLSWPCNDLSGATCREPRSSKKGEGLHGQNSFPGTSTGTVDLQQKSGQLDKSHAAVF